MNITAEHLAFISMLVGIGTSIVTVVGVYWKLKSTIEKNTISIDSLDKEFQETKREYKERDRVFQEEFKVYVHAQNQILQDISSIKTSLELLINNYKK